MKTTFKCTKSAVTFCLLAQMFISFSACKSDADSGNKEYKDQVVIHSLSDAQGLHPTNISDSQGSEIKRYMMQKLLEIDFTTLQLMPWMAKALPTVENIELNGKPAMKINYELRDGMTWDDGKPITPRDVEFSFMAVLNKKVDAPTLRPYIEHVVDFQYDPSNPMKFSFIWDEPYMLWDHVTGNDIWIIPEHLYDRKSLMKDIKLKDFAAGKMPAGTKAEEFAKEYNDTKYSREKGFINGSGPYAFSQWNTNQRIILERKANWWGDKLAGGNNGFMFDKGPQRIVFETINEFPTAITTAKGEKLDIVHALPPDEWVKIDESDKLRENFQKSNPPHISYSYIGLNTKSPLLQDKKVRQALAHLIDADNINAKILHNLQTRTIGPISPLDTMNYDKNIQPYAFDPQKAKTLLSEAGWTDSDGNGIVDKKINGKTTDFKLIFNFNQGNDIRKKVGLALKEEARKVGIEIEVVPMDWSVYLENLKKGKINMFYGAWVQDPRPSDMKQIFHTTSQNGGSNYVGFGNAESDRLIEDINRELDPTKRKLLYYRMQEILHDEVPYIFLYNGTQRNIIHKRFTNIHEGARDPGYWGGGLQLNKGFSATAL